ncbi:flagellar protein FlaG [Massilia horti]|uniref:Flagellar protein FlaG n=1 Tax=Massilia horti TaxID=2562153 RepID=A0A4Y9SS27_9BURK|nr:flagellar protein FlaG [Massilia horti]TFW29510.1 flagellar protein FlaG [Massilia horti]
MNIHPVGSPVTLKTEERVLPVAEAPQPPPAEPAAPSRAQVAAAVKHINQSLPASSNTLEFAIDEDSKQTVVKIVDQNTKEVVRQIPSAEALEIAKSLDKMMGLLISQKA